MGDTDGLIGADKYLHSRRIFRERARTEFFARNHAESLVTATNDYVAGAMLAASGHDMEGIPNAEYIGGLMVSFTRTHFIAMDLIVCSELIDSSTLVRKQFELVARLKELSAIESLDNLLKKTPNLRVLKEEVRRLYGEYSRIAHSAHPEPLQLLGTIETEAGDYTPLYPVFVENAYIALNHAVHSVIEYYTWAHPFCSRYYQSYNVEWGEAWLDRVAATHKAMFDES